MLLLGMLLAGATAAFVGLLIAYNLAGGPEHTVAMFGNNIATLNGLGIFLAGLALALIFGLATAMMKAGAAHHRRRSARLRQARRESAQATAERDRLAARVGDPDTAAGAAPGTSTGSSSQAGRSTRRRRLHLFGH